MAAISGYLLSLPADHHTSPPHQINTNTNTKTKKDKDKYKDKDKSDGSHQRLPTLPSC